MKTLILKNTEDDIKRAGQIIRDGGLVAFPTETVYGLGANGLDEVAAGKIYKAKGRPSDNPMILHISQIDDIYDIAEELTEDAKKLINTFWPGPLTVVVKSKAIVPKVTTGGLDTVGIRMPKDIIARDLIRQAGVPIAAPSANLSGKPSPTNPQHVLDDMDGRIDAIVFGGECQVGIESTVVSVVGETPVILRPGKITQKELSDVLGKEVAIDPALKNLKETSKKPEEDDFKPMAPGMKYRHYAPNAEMLVICGNEENIQKEIEKRKKDLESDGKKVGVIFFHQYDYETAAHQLFTKLRYFDKEEVDFILAGAVDDKDFGFAVMNRMLKSAGQNIIKV